MSLLIGYRYINDKKKNTAISIFILETVDVSFNICYNTT